MSTFLEAFAQSWPVEQWQKERTILACSGGADSVALVRAMHALAGDSRERLIVAHFNHRLRDSASDEDAQFVANLALQLELKFVQGAAEPGQLAQAGQDGMEAAARAARYKFLLQVAHNAGARYILTAHNADDQIETVLHHILRGTGLAGLAGIGRHRLLSGLTIVVRPMLEITRAQVELYLHDLQQTYRQDASNQETDYTRNRLRLKLLPQLEQEYNPQVRAALLRLSQQATDALIQFDALTDGWQDEGITELPGGKLALDIGFFGGEPLVLLRHFLVDLWKYYQWPRQGMTAEHWERLAVILQNCECRPATSFHLPGKILVEYQPSQLQLLLTPPRAQTPQSQIVDDFSAET